MGGKSWRKKKGARWRCAGGCAERRVSRRQPRRRCLWTACKVWRWKEAGVSTHPSLQSSQEVLGRGERLSPLLRGGQGGETAAGLEAGSQVHAHRRTWGAPGWGLRGADWGAPGRAHAGGYGGARLAQCLGHPAALCTAFAGRGLEGDRGEEGAPILVAGAAQPPALSGDRTYSQIQERQRLQMVSDLGSLKEPPLPPGMVPFSPGHNLRLP